MAQAEPGTSVHTHQILLWRDGPSGARQGLLLSLDVCPKSARECREVHFNAWQVEDRMDGVASSQPAPALVISAGSNLVGDTKHWSGGIHVDTGKVSRTDPEACSEEVATWLEELMPHGLLDAVRHYFTRTKEPGVRHRDLRARDWSWWQPGLRVAWRYKHPEAVADRYQVGTQRFVVEDTYCVEPGCTCQEIWLEVVAEQGEKPEARCVGNILLSPAFPDHAIVDAHGANRLAVLEVWTALRQRHNVQERFSQRRAVMHALGPELHALRRQTPPRGTSCH